MREAKRLSVGMASFVLPSEVFDRRRARDAAGRSVEEDAHYGYSVWLRHLVIGSEHGPGTHPAHVLELARSFRSLSPADLQTAIATIQARKPVV